MVAAIGMARCLFLQYFHFLSRHSAEPHSQVSEISITVQKVALNSYVLIQLYNCKKRLKIDDIKLII